MSLCTSFHFILIHVPQALLTRLSQNLILFFLFPILILLCVFRERPLHLFCSVMNKCLLSMSSLPLCLWDSCQTQSKRGDTASHYSIADDWQCVPWRLKNEIQRHPCLSVSLTFSFSLSLSLSLSRSLSLSYLMSRYTCFSFYISIILFHFCYGASLTYHFTCHSYKHIRHHPYL